MIPDASRPLENTSSPVGHVTSPQQNGQLLATGSSRIPGVLSVTGSRGIAEHSGSEGGHVTGSGGIAMHSGSEDEDEELNVPTVFSTMSTR